MATKTPKRRNSFSGDWSKLGKDKKKKVKKAKKREFLKEIGNYPTLEELLWAMNGMEKCKVFTKLKFDEDGNIAQAFTKKGGELYERLVSLIYGVFTLVTGGDNMVDTEHITANDIVETLDNIVREET
jgi:hypothetical protein